MQRTTKQKLDLALISAIIGFVFILAPVVFVRRTYPSLSDPWQELAFYAVCIIGAVLGGWHGFSLSSGSQEIKRQRNLVWGSAVFYFLYLSCAVLCQKIHFGALDTWWWRTAGLIIFIAGVYIRLWAISTLGRLHSGFVTIQEDHTLIRSGPYRWLRHPSYLGVLVATVGVPMIFGSWFPLLAVPGGFVALKWRMDDEERLLAETFGEKFEDYKRETWRLIPYIY